MAVQPGTCLDHTEDGSSGEITTARHSVLTTMPSVPVSAETWGRKDGTPGSIATDHRHKFQLVRALSH